MTRAPQPGDEWSHTGRRPERSFMPKGPMPAPGVRAGEHLLHINPTVIRTDNSTCPLRCRMVADVGACAWRATLVSASDQCGRVVSGEGQAAIHTGHRMWLPATPGVGRVPAQGWN